HRLGRHQEALRSSAASWSLHRADGAGAHTTLLQCAVRLRQKKCPNSAARGHLSRKRSNSGRGATCWLHGKSSWVRECSQERNNPTAHECRCREEGNRRQASTST